VYLSEPQLYIDELRLFLLRIILQAKLDIVNLLYADAPVSKHYWDTACSFIFSEGYTIRWGKYEISLKDIMETLDLEEDWVLENLSEQLKNHLRRRYGNTDERGNPTGHN
jgi:hypothetical protein